ncbi:protein SIEVE ELEMENT OCCLUSION C [Diospyros lotus]|uniref:protein SIEVE ELEMENT OCCLUSION C n=1 Tax=Diospyros lotus TaxID=55363 RepID=UPI0022505A7C|nr:protein SIEVE ELEMENT OCCLUSION C [Diospyros lotus]
MAMDSFGSTANYASNLSSPGEEDFLTRPILLSHDPDGRRLDTELLLQAVENILYNAAPSQVSNEHDEAIAKSEIGNNIDVVASEEPLGQTIYKLSRVILYNCSVVGDTHSKTMMLFEMLGSHRWDAKAVLVLAAFVSIYGEFWLVMQLCTSNPLAASVALLKQLPACDLSFLKPRFKALSTLLKAIIDVIRCIINFEGLPVDEVIVEVEDEAIGIAKSQIRVAIYWVIRSVLRCSFCVKELTAMENVQGFEFNSHCNMGALKLGLQVGRHNQSPGQADGCLLSADSFLFHPKKTTETKMHDKLFYLFNEPNIDNQEVLGLLFSFKDNLPLKHCASQSKLGLSDLRNKIVILLISKPELFPLEMLLLLVQNMFDHPERTRLEGGYEILWVPISSSDSWTYAEKESFEFLSNSLSWLSIRRPWLLSSMEVKFIKFAFGFEDEPLMVVLDTQGMITNLNAIDMALIWGAEGYPFSVSRENELWESEAWNLQLLLDRIDPLVAKWVEENREICIYGGGNLDWIREFTAKMKGIISAGLKLDRVYVGNKNSSDERIKDVLATMREEKQAGSLTFTKIKFFWLRLESMRRSKLRLGYTDDGKDRVLEQLSRLLEADDGNEKGWVLMGRGASKEILMLQGREAIECLELFKVWGKNVAMLGLVGAIKAAMVEPPLNTTEPCHHSYTMPYVEGLEEVVVCEKCHRPMEKFVFYECEKTE